MRATKTAAQVAVATLGSNGVGLLDANLAGAASLAGMAFVLSFLNSLTGLPEVEKDWEAKPV